MRHGIGKTNVGCDCVEHQTQPQTHTHARHTNETKQKKHDGTRTVQHLALHNIAERMEQEPQVLIIQKGMDACDEQIRTLAI